MFPGRLGWRRDAFPNQKLGFAEGCQRLGAWGPGGDSRRIPGGRSQPSPFQGLHSASTHPPAHPPFPLLSDSALGWARGAPPCPRGTPRAQPATSWGHFWCWRPGLECREQVFEGSRGGGLGGVAVGSPVREQAAFPVSPHLCLRTCVLVQARRPHRPGTAFHVAQQASSNCLNT